MALTQRKRVGLAAFGSVQNILAGGLVFGWASVSNRLLVASPQDGGPGLTLDETTSIFALAACISSIASLFLGIILDKYGPRVCSFVSHVIIALGCQIFALANTYGMFSLGACLIGFGGPGIQSSVVHLANLFPESQFLVMTLVTGSLTLSFAVLPLFEFVWEHYGVGFRSLFGSYVIVVLLSAVGSLLFWPDKSFEHEDSEAQLAKSRVELEPTPEEEFVEASLEHLHLVEQPLDSYLRTDDHRHHIERKASYIASREAIEKGDMSLLSLKDLPFRQQVSSGAYARTVTVFVLTSFLANFYVASIAVELADIRLFTETEQYYLTSTFSLIISAGIFSSFIVGWLMDKIGLESCTLLTLLLGQLHLLIVIFLGSVTPMMVLSFVFYMLFRQFLFPVYIACLSSRLGFKYFGILSGLGFAIAGLVQLLMTSMVRHTQGTCHMALSDDCASGEWIQLHFLQLGLLCFISFLPVWDYRDKIYRQCRVQMILGGSTRTDKPPSYGALATEEGGDIEIQGTQSSSW